ncbi:MAG: hydroxyisourate hydrolase [Candidatus Sericytochromatia bacterium]|nr:hydroxyisourate hydrolase [Candidatus Sericytochromatia bacterium]
MSQITTHVLDTSKGKPAANIPILLEQSLGINKWQEIALGSTNKDGRASNLLTDGKILEKGIYRISFDTDTYFKNNEIDGFYPMVSIVFKIESSDHYHVPLLLNPYGYSTYRGS